MLSRWRNQMSAKQLEEERAATERERGHDHDHGHGHGHGLAHAHSPSNAPHSPASDASSPRSPTSTSNEFFPSTAAPEPPSTPSFLDGQRDADTSGLSGTPSASDPATEGVADAPAPGESASGDAQKAPTPSPKDETQNPQVNPDSSEQIIGRDALLTEQEAKEEKSTSIAEDSVETKETQGTMQEGSDSSPQDSASNNNTFPTSDNDYIVLEDVSSCEDEENGVAHLPEDLQESDIMATLTEASIKSDTIETDSENATENIGKKNATATKDEISPGDTEKKQWSKSIESSEAKKAEDITGSFQKLVSPQNTTLSPQTSEDEAERQYVAVTPSPHSALQQRPRGQPSREEFNEIYRRPPTRFQTVNYLSQLSVAQCLQRTYGAAKASSVTGCAVSCMEMGVCVAATPAVLLVKICDWPLQCTDRVISKSVSSIVRVLTCASQEACCGVPGCKCGNQQHVDKKTQDCREESEIMLKFQL